MRFQLTIITVLIGLISCVRKEKSDGLNFLVKDKEDTVSFFYYQHEKLKDHIFYDQTVVLDSIIHNKYAQTKLNAEFALGIKSKNDSLASFLVFRGVSPSRFELTQKPQTPFLDEEYKLLNDYRVVMTTHYIDSTTSPIRKIEILAAIDKQTQDTILFQDAIYAFKDTQMDEVVLTIVVYRNQEIREQMRLLLDDAVTMLKRSTLDSLK